MKFVIEYACALLETRLRVVWGELQRWLGNRNCDANFVCPATEEYGLIGEYLDMSALLHDRQERFDSLLKYYPEL